MFETGAVLRPVELGYVEALRQELTGLFQLDDTTIDWPQPGHVRFRGTFLCDPADCYKTLRTRFERHGFTPVVREEAGQVAITAIPEVFDPPASKWWINLILFLLTILSTLYVGAMNEPEFVSGETILWSQIWRGWPFSLCILLILGAHELGHYFAARYHGVPVTLPYFIPVPTIFGTMGAFIRLKAPVADRRALFDVGVAGPLAGLVFALPILFIGLLTSNVEPLPATSYSMEGNSIFYALAKALVFGRFLPSGGEDVFLNQVAWAGWAGLFVTGLNLIPIGQLDGGHVAYSLFGEKAKQLYWPFIIGLGLIALLVRTWAWTLWILLLFFLGRVYAEPLNDVTRLDGRRRLLGYFTLLIFVLVFVPNPIRIVVP